MDQGLISVPRQRERKTRETQGVDIDYHLGWDMDTLREHMDTLLLAIEQDAARYKRKFPECGFHGKVYFKHVGKTKLPPPIGIHTWLDPDLLVEGSERTKDYSVRDALEALLEDRYEVTQRLRGIHIRVYQRIP